MFSFNRWRIIAAIVAGLFASACGELPKPFKPDAKGLALSPFAQLGDVSGVVVAPIQNAPPGVGDAMADSVAVWLRKANAPATTTGALTNGHLLEGWARIVELGGGPVIVVDWVLTNPANVIVDRRATRIAPIGPARPSAQRSGGEWPAWRRIDDAAIRRASEEIATAVAALLQSNTPVKKDLPRAQLAVASVTGATGDGNESLKRAFEAMLRRAGLPVAATMEEATVLIYGEVTLKSQDDTVKVLEINWSFRGPDGRELGVMSQHNQVRNNQVNARWGSLAYDITLAAIEGVVSILKRRDEIDALTRP